MNDRDTMNSIPVMMLLALAGFTIGFVGSVFTVRFSGTWQFYVALAMMVAAVLLLFWNMCLKK